MSLPNAPKIPLSSNVYIQPPLSRRGHGPGLIVFLPSESTYPPLTAAKKPLDPEPVLKWAEEGFAVLAVQATRSHADWALETVFTKGLDQLRELKELDEKDSFAIAVYDPNVASVLGTSTQIPASIKCIISNGQFLRHHTIPTLSHISSLAEGAVTSQSQSLSTAHSYTLPPSSMLGDSAKWSFILPTSAAYHPPSSSVAHTRSLVFIKSHLKGPYFDIEAVWEEHTLFEFVERNVEKTMATMVQEPYVNHVPTMTGGMGREKLTAFYRDHFIFANPPDTEMVPISRTIGPDRVVDEFIVRLTHDREIPWFLPGVPPSHRKIEVPFVGVINVRGDRLYHEHIWWDQATALRQVGVLPEWVSYPPSSSDGDGNPTQSGEGKKKIRLPVTGQECARLLADETDGESNAMFGNEWGVHPA